MPWIRRPRQPPARGTVPPPVPNDGAFDANDFSSDFDIGVPGFVDIAPPLPAYGQQPKPTPTFNETVKPLPAWGRRTPTDSNWS